MSDLSRLRARLVSLERSGRRYRGLLEDLRERVANQPGPLDRRQEREIALLGAIVDERRKEWLQVRAQLHDEERRLASQPDAFLRFT